MESAYKADHDVRRCESQLRSDFLSSTARLKGGRIDTVGVNQDPVFRYSSLQQFLLQCLRDHDNQVRPRQRSLFAETEPASEPRRIPILCDPSLGAVVFQYEWKAQQL